MRNRFPNNNFVPPKMGSGLRLGVGEAPGEEESFKLEPFVGGAGRILDSVYARAGVKREEVSLVNCIQCRPPDNVFPTDPAARSYISRDEADAAVAHCKRAHVDPVLAARPWKRIDLFGDKALEIVGGKREGITTWRGSPIALPGEVKPRTIPTYHPAYVARNQVWFPLVSSDLMKSLVVPEENYNLHPTVEEVRAFEYKVFAADIETEGRGFATRIKVVGLCGQPGTAIVVPFSGQYKEELRRIFRDAREAIFHNGCQFDMPILRDNGIEIGEQTHLWDTMLLSHLRFPDFPKDLEFVASMHTSKPCWKEFGRGSVGYWELRCARDCDVTFASWKRLHQLCSDSRLLEIHDLISVPLGAICKRLSDLGIAVDSNNLGRVSETLKAEMVKLEVLLPPEMRSRMEPIQKREPAPAGTLGKSGKPVKFIMVPAEKRVTPWRSPDQKQRWLYGKDETWQLGLPVQTDYKTKRVTTGKLALSRLMKKAANASDRAAIEALRKLNRLDELVTTFTNDEVRTVGRQHPHFNVHGTATGRLSSSDPNLQNIPPEARYIYVPSDPGWSIVSVDYSSIESRLAAWFAGDKELLARYDVPGWSEYKWAASLFFDMPYEDVLKDNSRDAPYGKAKIIVLGGNYGLGALKISKDYDMDFKEVRELLTKLKQIKPKVAEWQKRTTEEAAKNGVLTNPFGRKRWFYTSSLYTESLAYLPQSTAADMIFRAMVGLMYERVNWALEKAQAVAPIVHPLPEPCRMLLQVHDELVFECPDSMLDATIKIIRTVMEQPFPELKGWHCPVNVAVGKSWGEVATYRPPLASN